MVREIALDLEDKDKFEQKNNINTLLISGLKFEILKLEEVIKKQETKIDLRDRYITIVQSQYDAEKEKKADKYDFNDFLFDFLKFTLGALTAFGVMISL